jgi:putative oxidoreductase
MGDLVSWAALVLRVGGGLVVLAHGFPKAFGTGKKFEVGRANLRNTIEKLGLPFPGLWTHGVAVSEVVGGACLLLGLFGPWVAWILAVVMLVATYWKQKTAGFSLGADLPFALLFMMIALILLGDGQFSLGALLGLGR